MLCGCGFVFRSVWPDSREVIFVPLQRSATGVMVPKCCDTNYKKLGGGCTHVNVLASCGNFLGFHGSQSTRVLQLNRVLGTKTNLKPCG